MTEFPRLAWSRAARRVLATTPADRFTYLAGQGMPELRSARAGYLDRVRTTVTDPERVVVCGGFLQGLHLIARVLAERGARRVAHEEPYDPIYRRAIASAGLEAVPIPVDADELVVDRIAAADVQAFVVTPTHQFPTWAVLAPERRADRSWPV